MSATAPGKFKLFGEHAVVYRQPALAVPVTDVQARVSISPAERGAGLRFEARDLGESFTASSRPESPLARMAAVTLAHFGQREPDAVVTIESTIPVAGGLGSGAAVSAALGRALASFTGPEIDNGELSALVFEIEKLHHGTPSGIDNTVICHASPVYFVRGQEPQTFHVGRDFHLLIGDTGQPSSTKLMVEGVRERWSSDRERYEALFAAIGDIVRRARTAIEIGGIDALGPLMQDNQTLLKTIGVSSASLDRLIDAALAAGAAGAKLSGGGGGGNMIAIINPDRVYHVRAALEAAGAARTIHTVVRSLKG